MKVFSYIHHKEEAEQTDLAIFEIARCFCQNRYRGVRFILRLPFRIFGRNKEVISVKRDVRPCTTLCYPSFGLYFSKVRFEGWTVGRWVAYVPFDKSFY